MYNILSILMYISNLIKTADPRIVKLDEEHIIDTKTSVKFHLYDDYFKVTHGDETILTNQQMTAQEQEAMWGLKMLIQDPAVTEQRKKEYPDLVRSKRRLLSDLFADPKPIGIMEEDDTMEYTG